MATATVSSSKKYVLMFGDILILYFSLLLTLLIRYSSDYQTALWNQHLLPFTVVAIIFIAVFYIDDLYEPVFSTARASLLGRIIRNVIIAVIVSFGFFYLGQDRLFSIKPQRVILIDAAIFTVVSYVWHSVFISLTKSAKVANNILYIGQNQLVDEITQAINSNPQLGFKVKATLNQSDNFDDLKQRCLDEKINTIVSTIHPRDNASLAKNLFDCLPLKINFFNITNFYEKIIGKVPVTTVEQVWFLENLSESNKNLYEVVKRVFDILLSLVLLVGALPFVPVIALMIKLSSSGPIFFVQTRTGKQGKDFKAIKFRTMVANAETNGAQWATKNDPRVTALGKIMRQTRIDEIPQLINVIKGEMSMIGPRPERPEFVEELEKQIPFYKERLLVRPGLSGWAQVAGPAYGGSREESLEKLQYDLFYIKNRSFGLDLSIALKTIKTIITRKGQ